MFPWTGCRQQSRRFTGIAVFGLCLHLACAPLFAAAEDPPYDPVWEPVMRRLVADGFDPLYIRALFAQDEVVYAPEVMGRKMNTLLRTKLSPPGEKGAEPQVDERYLSPIQLAGAYGFMREHKAVLAEIRSAFQVPPEIVTALMLVETKLGRAVGTRNAFVTLASMAASMDVERFESFLQDEGVDEDVRAWLRQRTSEKADWAYDELVALIRYARAAGQSPLDINGSIFGAIGLCQFMPSNVLAYGLDGGGDGKVDLMDMRDALFSMANFLKRHGWSPQLDETGRFKVIYRYNHSGLYARTVLAVAKSLADIDKAFGGD